MAENSLNELVKQVEYIPFTKKEVAKALERKLNQNRIETVKRIKEVLQSGTLKTDKDCFVGYEGGLYFLFQANSEEKNPGDSSFNMKIMNQFECVWPTKSQVPIISKAYNGASDFIASNKNNNCTVLTKIENEWKYEDWEIPAYPVGVYNIENCSNENNLFYFLITHGIGIKDVPDIFSHIVEIKSVISTENDNFIVDENSLLKVSFSDELRDEIYEEILKGMNLPRNPTSQDVRTYLKNSDKIRIGLEEYTPAYFDAFDQWFWDLWTDEKPSFYKQIKEDYDAGKIFARNPRQDVKRNSLIAIDFGTSSTVVVEADMEKNIRRQICVGGVDAYENPTLMYIENYGKFLASYLSKNTRPNTKWEDLQVSHRVREYMGNAGKEKIKSIVSHIKQWAADRDKNLFVKPANADEAPITIRPLETLVDSKETADFNPIEIYAYFLGLFLNNRQPHHGIYLKYHLSYPAKYPEDVIEHIVESFRRGIRKSIPSEISDDEIIVEKTVSEPEAYATVALQEYGFEPEKYEDKVKFSVFDFGGGTSDFAYGYWSGPSQKAIDKDRSLETIAIGGDPYLGGENLLDGLAYKVFADSSNLTYLSNGKFLFNYGVKGQEKKASPEILKCISSDYFATNNLTTLIENSTADDDGNIYNLRSLWEKQEEHFIKYLNATDIASSALLVINEIDALLENVEDASLKKELEEYKKEAQETKPEDKDVDLINHRIKLHIEAFKKRNPEEAKKLKSSSDVLKATLMLWYQRDKINQDKVEVYISKSLAFDYFTSKIGKGLEKFFIGMEDAFKEDFTGSINIFLAGNSSKSPIFLKLMREKINQIQLKQAEKGNQIKFELFERFDSENYSKLLRYAGNEIHHWPEAAIDRLIETKAKRPETDKPTGKTGVAFGIIEYLTGNIEVVHTEKKFFKYFLGFAKKRMGINTFIPFDSLKESQGKPSYPPTGDNKGWYEIFEVTPSENPVNKTLYYSEDHRCMDETQNVDDIAQSKLLTFERIPDGHKIYIKAIENDRILYVTAKDPEQAEEYIKSLGESDLKNITIQFN